MKTVTVTRGKFLALVIVWWAAFAALSLTGYNGFQLENIIGFLALAILPGMLTMVISKIKGLPFWGYLSAIVGFSLLDLMVIALLGNTFLPFFGILRPLDKPVLILEFYFLIGILAATAWVRMESFELQVKRYWLLFESTGDALLALLPMLFVPLSIFGAIHLNNGGSNVITMAMLGAIAAYIAVLVVRAKKIGENVAPTAIFFIALSLLFMTSLRGWFVTGHDIQQEMQFFELAKINGFWNLAASSNAYNACLSITILPTVFANLLRVADQYVFKIFFQMIFALAPVLAYLIGRQWFDRRISLIGTVYFLAFPTFFTDMPFLIRQEVAFVFFGLMLYFVFESSLEMRIRRLLFILMGIGVILSHYSTTYTVLAIFGITVVSAPLLAKVFRIEKKPRPITLMMVMTLFILSFLWTSTITHTGGQLQSVVQQTATAVQNGFGGDNRSIDAMSLLSFTSVDPSVQLQDYLSTTVQQIRSATPAGTYFPTSTYADYQLTISADPLLPPSHLSDWLGLSGINFAGLSSHLSTILGKLMEIMVPLGIAAAIFKKRLKANMDEQFLWIALYSIMFVAANIILPVLSAQYGVFRAMQQSLFVLGFFIVIGSDLLGQWFSAALVVLFFVYSTSLVPQLMGNNTPALHLNDAGIYYDNYLIKGEDVSGEAWLMKTLPDIPATNLQPPYPPGMNLMNQTEFQAVKTFQSLAGATDQNGVLPALIQRNSFVFLGEGTVVNDQAAFDYNGNLVGYSYPIQFLDKNKDLLYNNGGSRVYK